ncbi:MAG: hypothetical protein ACR2OZ_16560 [Verrucomicrobiales bacterium]
MAELAPLAGLLRRRREIIGDHRWRDADPTQHLEALRQISEEIGVATEGLRGQIPPRLEHFLRQCSFDKALGFIEEVS